MYYENEIPEQTDALQEVHSRALLNFDAAYTQNQEVRQMVVEDIRFITEAGAMWEGNLSRQFAGRPKMEQDLISREIDRIYGEYCQNRVTVNFRPADTVTDDKASELLDGMFRADMEESDGQEATDNAILDAIKGGFGAVRLKVDDYDDDYGEKKQRICIDPIYDAADSVWFDPNSKKADKSDAKWAVWLQRMRREAYEEEWGEKAATSFATPGMGLTFDAWFAVDWVYIAKYYECEEVNAELVTYIRPDTGESAEYERDAIEDVIDDLTERGFLEQATRKVKRKKVHLYCMDGNVVLEDEGYIAGEHIPLVPMYGRRAVLNGVEYVEGIVRKAKDSQRIHNMQISLLSDAAAGGARQRPIVAPMQVKGLEGHWANKDVSNTPYLPLHPLVDKAGNLLQAGPLAYEQPPQIPPAMQALVELTTQGIAQITGANPSLEQTQSNVSAEAMQSATARADSRSYNIADQARKMFKRIGIVYKAMAKEVYAEPRDVRVIAPDGTDSIMRINDEVIDAETGRPVVLNGLAKMKFNVAVDVGPSFNSQKDATVSVLQDIYAAMDPADPKRGAVLSMMIDNLTADGIDDLKRINRQQMLASGVAQPRNDEEIQIVIQAQQAAANQPPDPQSQALIAVAAEAEAKAQKAQADTMKAMAEVEKFRAETAETLTKVDANAMQNAQELAAMIRSSQEEMLAAIGEMMQRSQMSMQPELMPVQVPQETTMEEMPSGNNPEI